MLLQGSDIMKIYVYLDESGSIHKNSKTKFFAVGGYIISNEFKNKAISTYKKINKNIKDIHHFPLDKEIKSYHMTNEEKINIFSHIQNINTFYGCTKVFAKTKMRKEIIESNIFFNYAVKLLFSDCIIPLLKINNSKSKIDFIISIDNRNIRIGELNNLENYLKTEFCLENYNFKITYYDSRTNYGIQLADLIVNTFYNTYKNKNIVIKVLPVINKNKFRLSLFPSITSFYDIDMTYN